VARGLLDRKEFNVSDQPASCTTNDQADKTARVFGVALLCAGLALAYLVWPQGIADTTLVATTFGALLRAVAAIGIGIAAVVVAAMFWI
jgi:hypothetical protein